MDAHLDAPIALWLRTARASQRMDDGSGNTKSWTVKHFLERLEAEVGWKLAHSNYSNYEQGKQTPTPPTLRKFVTFWARYGVDAPDLTPKEPIVEPSVADLMREQIEATRENTRMLERVLMALVPSPPDPLVAEAQEAWDGAERRLAAEKAGTSRLPRRPSRARQPEARGQASREAERA